MKKNVFITILLLFSFSTFGVDKNSCQRVLRLIGQNSHPSDIQDSEASLRRVSQGVIRNWASKEVLADLMTVPLQRLRPGEIYTFIATDKEIRFASTSRSPTAIKNMTSKHGFLADGSQVHYAGEAWLDENGALVINHNSGSFRPNPEFLEDVAQYFRDNFGTKQINFSNTLPASKTLTDYKNQLKSYLKVRVTTVSEGAVNIFSRDNYQGQKIALGVDGLPGKDLMITVGDIVGSGTMGIVHHVKIYSMSKAAQKAFPHLVNQHDLVVKMPHNVPILKYLPGEDIFNSAIIREDSDLAKLKDIVQQFEQNAADVLFKGTAGDRPFLIKRFISSKSIQSLSDISNQLTPLQASALERDIYNMAKVVKERTGQDLDIKAENIAWDSVNKKFIMYELSIKKSSSFFLDDGFEGYLSYFNSRMNYWHLKRKPSSVQVLGH
jgi:hypothetical protein